MTRKIGVLALFQLFVLSCAVVAQTAPAATDWKTVEQALGRPGQLQGDGAYKFGLPRGDLKVTVDAVQVKPTLALGSWVAFSSPGPDAMLMGDLVLAEDEVSPVMLALQENGLQITALHNHVLHETPRVMYMHIAGQGDAVKLADAVKKVISLTKTTAAAAFAIGLACGAPCHAVADTDHTPRLRRRMERDRTLDRRASG